MATEFVINKKGENKTTFHDLDGGDWFIGQNSDVRVKCNINHHNAILAFPQEGYSFFSSYNDNTTVQRIAKVSISYEI